MWLRLRRHKPEAAPQARLAQREQEAKLRDLRTQRPEVHRQIDRFAVEVEAAIARRRPS